jgi:ribose transport system permease protein
MSDTKAADAAQPTFPEPATTDDRGSTPRGALQRLRLSRFSGFAIWAAFFGVFAIWVPSEFVTASTWQDIVSEQSVTAILAIGILFPLAAGVYDLSIGTTLGLAAVVTAKLTAENGYTTPEVLALTVGIGLAIGLLNAAFVVGIGINSFIATLGMSSILTAMIEAFTNGNFISSVPLGYQSLVANSIFGIPEIAAYVLAIGLLAWYGLEHAPFGRRLAAIGFGAEASRLAGVPTGRLVASTLVISAVLAAIAGALLTAQLGTATPDLGPPYLLPAYAAAFLGSTQLKPGRFNVGGTILAIALLATGVKGLQLVGASDWVTDLFDGVALIVAVGASLANRHLAALKRFRWITVHLRRGSA